MKRVVCLGLSLALMLVMVSNAAASPDLTQQRTVKPGLIAAEAATPPA